MNVHHNPAAAYHGPGHYSHAVEVPPGARWLQISGQLPVSPDGTLGDGIEAQSACAWSNLKGVLESAGMSLDDLVKITIYLTKPEDRPGANAYRTKVLGENPPASTGIIITALADPAWLIEIEAVAAR